LSAIPGRHSSGHDGAGVVLGVFMAQTSLARIGATLQFGNRNPRHLRPRSGGVARR
jgi:hypothetical protein